MKDTSLTKITTNPPLSLHISSHSFSSPQINRSLTLPEALTTSPFSYSTRPGHSVCQLSILLTTLKRMAPNRFT